MWICSSWCFPLFASFIFLPFLFVIRTSRFLLWDCGLCGKGQIHPSELQIIPFGLWLLIQVVKQSKKLPTKPKLSGVKLVQTSYWGFLGNMSSSGVSREWCAHYRSPASPTTGPGAHSPVLPLDVKDRPSKIQEQRRTKMGNLGPRHYNKCFA